MGRGMVVSGRALVGTSGWMYRAWRGRVYPVGLPQRRWFEHYASLFDTVETNSTFYRLPTEAAVAGWAAQAPPGFVFAVKLGAFGSHRMKLGDAASWLPHHVARFAPLGPALGPTLVQLPPTWRRNASRLDEMLSLAPRTMRWAVELREPSWVHDEVFDVLRRHGAALVIHDLLEAHPVELTTGWTYLRFHGPNAIVRPYQDAYGRRRLRPWADRIAAWTASGLDVHAYFNNDVGGHAVDDAMWLRSEVARLSLRVPRPVTPRPAAARPRRPDRVGS